MRSVLVWASLLAAMTFTGCGQNGADIEELKKGQKDILAKLDAMDKNVQQIKAAPAAAGARPPMDPNKVYTISIADSPVRGPKDAKVTIVEFSDFQCPFCAQSKDLVDQVLKAYPKDVNFVYKQFPLTTIHPFALGAAKAAVAAGKQGKFWEMHDLMFANNRELGVDKLKEYAGKAGCDVPKWEKDFNDPATQAQVDKEVKDAQAADVQGTPTFFVGGKRVQNRSLDGFKQMIDDQVQKKG
jgi:protein-disulfide isomerase